jgi:UDP-2-acetamido-2,6-beta-L-arabino-hexul-4-ose reductase
VRVFRLPGVFGKWCRPHYNSVVATFCHCVARGEPINVSDPARVLDLVHVGDVVRAFVGLLDGVEPPMQGQYCGVEPVHQIALGALADKIRGFREARTTLEVTDLEDALTRLLHSTYLSYLPDGGFAYSLDQRVDPRGELAELLRSRHFGQIFVSRTRPGITRGNHYHDAKFEKFVVVEGEAVVRFRSLLGGGVSEYPVSGRDFKVVDIPPGYTHHIENVGSADLVVLFWASEPFDQQRPDTWAKEV